MDRHKRCSCGEDTMKWTNILKEERDFTKLPEGLRVSEFSLTPEHLANSRTKYDDYEIFHDVAFRRELGDIVSALTRLKIDVSFAALEDLRYHNSDGLYNWDEKSGLAVKLKTREITRTLYFVIETEGAWTEDGGIPQVYVPRVLEDEDTFIAVVLQSLNIGEGPVKDPASSISRERQGAYSKWWHSLPREERGDPDSRFPPPKF